MNLINAILPVIKTELRKVLRSTIFWITIVFAAFMPLMLGLLMFVKKYPDLAHSTLLLSKATMLPGNADWPAFFGLFAQMIAGAGLALFGFVASWLFGREYSDRTVKDLLALPLPRWSFVTGKFIIMALWCIFLFVTSLIVMLCVGKALRLDGWTFGYAKHCLLVISAAIIMDIWVSSVTSFVAILARGYLAPVGFTILALVLANFMSMLGFGSYYPWGIPMLFAMNGLSGTYPNITGIIIMTATGFAGFAGAILRWRFADQN